MLGTRSAGTSSTAGNDDGLSLLNDPIWFALMTGNAALAQGGPLAKRFDPEAAPFAAVAERSAAAYAALAGLLRPEDNIALFTPNEIAAPAGLAIDMQVPLVQMVLMDPVAKVPSGPEHVVLGGADVPDMLDLAGRTRPGPFGLRTIAFGHYVGLRADGALAAMAGERMRFGRFVEVSAVCVDPDHRGRGYAALLTSRVAHRIQAGGMTPFLHAFASNVGAIALYKKLGFRPRRTLYVTRLRRAEAVPTEGGPAGQDADHDPKVAS